MKVFKCIENLEDDFLIDGELYFLFDKFGNLVGYGKWEADNEEIYNSEHDIVFSLSSADYIMRRPSEYQLQNI